MRDRIPSCQSVLPTLGCFSSSCIGRLGQHQTTPLNSLDIGWAQRALMLLATTYPIIPDSYHPRPTALFPHYAQHTKDPASHPLRHTLARRSVHQQSLTVSLSVLRYSQLLLCLLPFVVLSHLRLSTVIAHSKRRTGPVLGTSTVLAQCGGKECTAVQNRFQKSRTKPSSPGALTSVCCCRPREPLISPTCRRLRVEVPTG